MKCCKYVKVEFTGLFVSSIKFLLQSTLLEAPSHLQQKSPQFILTIGLLNLDKQAPLSAAPGSHRTLRGSRLHALTWFQDFLKF